MPSLIGIIGTTLCIFISNLSYASASCQESKEGVWGVDSLEARGIKFKSMEKMKKTIQSVPADVKPEAIFKELHSFEGKMAERISDFSGSMWFVYLHIIWFVGWVLINRDLIPGIKTFDPFPYGLLTMIVSLEAIFLATFILINQNRQALLETYRELEEEQEAEEEQEEVEDIQKDLEDIKNAMSFIQQKLTSVEKANSSEGNGKS